MQRAKYYKHYKTNTGSSAADNYFMMNGDANGTLGFSPGHFQDQQQYGTIGTFGRAYELTVGGDS